MDRVIVFDTTLRDGELASGFSMNTMEKLEMARLQVDVIEASARAYLSALNRFAQSSSQRMKEVGP